MILSKLSDLKDKKITVMGLGINDGGVGVTNFLLKHGAKVLLTDLNSAEKLENSLLKVKKSPNLELVLGEHREKDFLTADIVLRNPAVPRQSKYLKLAESAHIPIEMESTLFFKLCPTRNIVGITGTKGKTTTSYLIYNLLKDCGKQVLLAGNMGISMVEQLEELTANSWVVLELSSFQIETMIEHGVSPYIGVYTNVLQDHIDRYGSFSSYAEVKMGMITHQSSNDFAVFNKDNKHCLNFRDRAPGNVYLYSQLENAIWVNNEKTTLPDNFLENRNLMGEHNYSNLLAAYCVSQILHLDNDSALNSLTKFSGVPHRLELVKTKSNVMFINDSAATMPDAALAALSTFENRNVVLLLGGKDKNLDFTKLVNYINDHKIKCMLLDPSNTASIIYKQTILPTLINGEYENLESAILDSLKLLADDGVLLLSPGCASPGMFINEFHRGDMFREIVKSII